MNGRLGWIPGKVLPLFLYACVGGCAAIVEWACFFVLHSLAKLHYQPATVAAMAVSTLSNWAFGRLSLFRNRRRRGLLAEIGKIYLVSIVGVLLNMALMWLLVERLSRGEMLSKVAATGLVFAYNYLVRRLYVYGNRGQGD